MRIELTTFRFLCSHLDYETDALPTALPRLVYDLVFNFSLALEWFHWFFRKTQSWRQDWSRHQFWCQMIWHAAKSMRSSKTWLLSVLSRSTKGGVYFGAKLFVFTKNTCPGWGSNSRPSDFSVVILDYETDALPTALPRPLDNHGSKVYPVFSMRFLALAGYVTYYGISNIRCHSRNTRQFTAYNGRRAEWRSGSVLGP